MAKDRAAADHVLRKRRDKMRAYFDSLAGKFGRGYVPGRSWKSLAEALLKLMPPMVIADLGLRRGHLEPVAGAARGARAGGGQLRENGRVRVPAGAGARAAKPRVPPGRHRGIFPIGDGEVDLAVFSQALHHAGDPSRALREARRILRPGGRVVVLDLHRHEVSQAKELYADVWLGFPEVELIGMMEKAGFRNVECGVVDRESKKPGFETLLAIGTRTG